MRRDALHRFMRFLGVGALGFGVDIGTFALALHVAGLDPALARPLAFAVSVVFTWALNRRFTFAPQASAKKGRELLLYVVSSLTAGAVNLSVYFAITRMLGTAMPLPYLALAAGVGAGLVVNFLLYSRVVFRRPGQGSRGLRRTNRPDKVAADGGDA